MLTNETYWKVLLKKY